MHTHKYIYICIFLNIYIYIYIYILILMDIYMYMCVCILANTKDVCVSILKGSKAYACRFQVGSQFDNSFCKDQLVVIFSHL